MWIPENPEHLEPPENPRTPTLEPRTARERSEPLTFNIQLLTASERSERATALGEREGEITNKSYLSIGDLC